MKKFLFINFCFLVAYVLMYAQCVSTQNIKNEQYLQNQKAQLEDVWKISSEDVEATVYNAVPAQCKYDFGYTASMFYLDLYNVEAHRIIAMERTFMKELGLNYGDVVKIEGTGVYDGIYQIQDTMNKRFAGKHKIDILVNESVKYGKWDNVKLYILKDKSNTERFTKDFKGKISKEENKKQMKMKRAEWKKNKN